MKLIVRHSDYDYFDDNKEVYEVTVSLITIAALQSSQSVLLS
jgi:hypothetical protein